MSAISIKGGRPAPIRRAMRLSEARPESQHLCIRKAVDPFEALDLASTTRHLDLYYAQATLLDKNWQPQSLGRGVAHRCTRHGCDLSGTTREGLRDACVFTTIINTNSPLQLDVPMAEGLITMAEHGQCNVITPFTLSGAMSPVTLAGALAQQHAEAMAGIVLTQIVRPGVPAMYGGFTSNVDMKSGAPAFGTPEYAQAAQASGQLARLSAFLPLEQSDGCQRCRRPGRLRSMMSLWGASWAAPTHSACGRLAQRRPHGSFENSSSMPSCCR